MLKTSENIKISTHTFYHTNLDSFSWEWRKKKFKMAVFQNRQFSNFFHVNFTDWSLGNRIDWCKGHWCSSTYMVLRLSDIRAKTGKKCIFCFFRLFLSLCQTASQPYRLSCINDFPSINHTNPRTNLWNLREKNMRIGDFEKRTFWKNRPFWFFVHHLYLHFHFQVLYGLFCL